MEQNPYTSPTTTSQPRRRRTYVLRGLAIVVWLAALALVIRSVQYFATPEAVERVAGIPRWQFLIFIALLSLQVIGLALLGMASWLRHKWLAVVGVAALAPPVVTLAIVFL